MIESTTPRYDWGLQVTVTDHVYNDDGTFPDVEEDALIIAAGSIGEIVRVGLHEESNMPVYLVDFGIRVVGLSEAEIVPYEGDGSAPVSETSPPGVPA